MRRLSILKALYFCILVKPCFFSFGLPGLTRMIRSRSTFNLERIRHSLSLIDVGKIQNPNLQVCHSPRRRHDSTGWWAVWAPAVFTHPAPPHSHYTPLPSTDPLPPPSLPAAAFTSAWRAHPRSQQLCLSASIHFLSAAVLLALSCCRGEVGE